MQSISHESDSEDRNNEFDLTAMLAMDGPRDFSKAKEAFGTFYFDPGYMYNDVDIQRRFMMPRTIFDRICARLEGRGVFRERRDAVDKVGISPKCESLLP